MAKITNGHSFGLTVQETLICYSLAYGESESEILRLHYNVNDTTPSYEKGKKRRLFNKLREKPQFQECYRAIVKQATQGLYSTALQKLGKQLELDPKDPKTMWVVNKAANDVINRYHDAIMGSDSKDVTVHIEGMPKLGKPEDMKPE